MAAEQRALVSQTIEQTYYMRGAIQYHDMLNMTHVERTMIREFIMERLKDQNGRAFPVY